MKKAIIIVIIILLTIITSFYALAGRRVKTVEIVEKAQLGLTGIYITVLDYKRVYPSNKEKELEPKKYIAFKVLLDGSKDRTGGDPPKHFGNPLGCDHSECYDTCGYFYVEGNIDERKNVQFNDVGPTWAVRILGNNSPIIGLGKVEKGVVEGWIVFEVPEEFETKKFIYRYREWSELKEILFPRAEVQVIFNETIK